jgi:hypothetical protein
MENLNVVKVTMLPDGRMDVSNAAKYVGLSRKTLEMYRVQGRGPRFIKKGRVFYRKSDLDGWLNEETAV